jgi:hypothetical protein
VTDFCDIILMSRGRAVLIAVMIIAATAPLNRKYTYCQMRWKNKRKSGRMTDISDDDQSDIEEDSTDKIACKTVTHRLER